MKLSDSGRIVIIDDQQKDAMPMIRSLGKYGFPFLYFDGSQGELPENPLIGIRFVLLDIQLKGMEGQPDKTKASGIVKILQKIISVKNGPYIIIFWTRHSEVVKLVIENCKEANIPPILYLTLEKSAYKGKEYGYNIAKITAKLKKELGSIGAFRLYIEWENIVNYASKRFVQDFSGHVKPGEDWSNQTSAIFYKLYKAYVDKNSFENIDDQFRCACSLINNSFLDTLQSISSKELKLPKGFKLTERPVDEEVVAKINTSLFISSYLLKQPTNGYVYFERNVNLKNDLNANIFSKGKAPAISKLCKVIITPECDIAQNKTIEIALSYRKNIKSHRAVYGILFPSNGEKKKDVKNRLEPKGRDAKFLIGPIWFKNSAQYLVFHFFTLSFQKETEFSGKPIFAIKRDLAFDLQSNAANHVNRLGNCQLG